MLSKSQIEDFKEAYGDPEIRHLRNESQVNVGIPFQVRAMREKRGWTQQALAEKLDTTQNTISRLESAKGHTPNISTLLRLAEAFDVALLVRFSPFSDFFDYNSRASHKSVSVPAFGEDLEDLEKSSSSLDDLVGVNSAVDMGQPKPPPRTISATDVNKQPHSDRLPSLVDRKPSGASALNYNSNNDNRDICEGARAA